MAQTAVVASDHFNDADGTLPGHGGGNGWSGSGAAKDGSNAGGQPIRQGISHARSADGLVGLAASRRRKTA